MLGNWNSVLLEKKKKKKTQNKVHLHVLAYLRPLQLLTIRSRLGPPLKLILLVLATAHLLPISTCLM